MNTFKRIVKSGIDDCEKPKSNRCMGELCVFGVVAVAAMMIGASIGYVIATEASWGAPTVIEPGSMVTDSYYTIFSNGATHFMRNGTTGAIDRSDADAASIVNYAVQNTPTGRTVSVVGNLNFTSPIRLTKVVNLLMDGNMTAWRTDFIVIGDEKHFVSGGTITLGSVTGVEQWKNTSCLRFVHSVSVNVYFSNIQLFENGIYFSPLGMGSGENSFYGGRVIACDYGIKWNNSGVYNETELYGIWSQGNRFYMSIFICDIAGFHAETGIASDMNFYYGTIDNMAGWSFIGPEGVPHGGGMDIYETVGGQRFILVFVGFTDDPMILNYRIGPATLLMTQNGVLIPEMFYKFIDWTVEIGANGTFGEWTIFYPVLRLPGLLELKLNGSFEPDEQVTVEIIARLSGHTGNPSYGTPLQLSFNSTGTYALTVSQLYSLTNNMECLFDIFVHAHSNNPTTSVTMLATCLV